MNKTTDFKVGDPVIYLGDHANKEAETMPIPEVGEVTSVIGEYVYVRFWNRDTEGNPTDLQETSKACKPENLHKKPN